MTTASNKLWTIGVIFLLGFFCTIRDDNGNPAAPGTDTPIDQPVDETLTPSLFATPDSAYVLPGDTIGIRVRAFGTSSVTDSVVPLASLSVQARSNRGSIIDDTILTDRDGRARFLFTSSEPGNVEIIISGSGVQQTVRFEVTETPIRIQKLLQAFPESSIIKADGRDSTVIAVAVLNTFRNPIIGECVQFISTAGTIIGNGSGCSNSGQSLTGSDGIARATLVSSNVNDTAYVTTYLVADQSLSDEVEVAFNGVTISVSTSKSTLKTGDTVLVVAKLLNASSQPVARAPIFFSRQKGAGSNLSILSVDTITNFEGVAVARIFVNNTGSDNIDIMSAGAKTSFQLNASDLLIDIVLPNGAMLRTSGTDTVRASVIFSNADNLRLANRRVQLLRTFKTAENVDTSVIITGTTDASGFYEFKFISLEREGKMRLQATGFDNTAGYASAEITLQFATTRQIKMRAPESIPADGVSRSPVTVFITNKTGNPIVGDIIQFTASPGTITAEAITDDDGKAVAVLVSDRQNCPAKITATLKSDPTYRDSTIVSFKGVKLTAAANPPSIRGNRSDSAKIAIKLVDAANIPIMGQLITLKPIHPENGKTDTIADNWYTDNAGEVKIPVRGRGPGQDTLRAWGAGDSMRLVINYTDNLLIIDTVGGDEYVADSSKSTRIVVTYVTAANKTPIPNATVNIMATVGQMDTIFAKKLTTDANGKIVFNLKNPHFAVTTTIYGIVDSNNDMTAGVFYLYFKPKNVISIDLSGTPEVITTGGSKARIKAIAYDSNNNRVKDAKITFNLVRGPSGGEYLDPPVAISGEDGVATTDLVSGNNPSFYRQVWITAGDFDGTKSDTIKFTIVGPPHYITIGHNIEKGENPNDGTFLLPCAAVVTDINGNPVVDGTEVTFSLQVSALIVHKLYGYWERIDNLYYSCGEIVITTATDRYPFEDLNNNYYLDPGEDRDRDGLCNRGENRYGDRVFNPGPPFEDINKDGKRQYNLRSPVEPISTCWRSSDSSYQREYIDFNRNLQWDPVEPLLDSNYLVPYKRLLDNNVFWSGVSTNLQDIQDLNTLAQLDSLYSRQENAEGKYGFDIDANTNGIPDPNTAISITRTVQTIGGKAINKILYAQSDASRIEVMLWAEAQGVVTESPAIVILPIIKGGGE